MCGIVGIVGARGTSPPSSDGVKRATRALRHRGPDGFGFHFDDAVAFGHTRLSIIDVEHGNQPLWNEDGTVVTIYNGEIWNYVELRDQLESQGHVFRTRADTEVLVHGYEEWGDDLMLHLNGMFAFAIWDEPRQRLLLARDRIGKKPLYVSVSEDGLAFGSDMRAVMLASGGRPELDQDKLAQFLFQRYVSAPGTLLRGVEKIPPGHRMIYDRESVRREAYWRLEVGDPVPLESSELRGLLLDSTRRRLMSDVPLGVLLSGGVDSSAVLGLMREGGAEHIASFTIGFDDPTYDERPWARVAARQFKTDHHEVVVGPSEFRDTLARLAWYRDEPVCEPSEIPLLLLAELAGQHVKVVLTGDGGDEVFGGYPKYRAERVLRAGGPAVATAFRLAGRVVARRPSHRQLERAIQTLSVRDPLVRWASWFRSFAPADVAAILAPRLRETASTEQLTQPLAKLLQPYASVDPGRRIQIGDLLTYLPDNMLARADKVLMGASVEGRMPLLDYRIVDRVANVAAASRAGLRTPKAILRAAISDLVPSALLNRSKRGFQVPLTRFLLEDDSLARIVNSDRCLERDLLDPDAVRAIVAGVAMDPQDRELKLFTLASLELWLRGNIDELRTEPPGTLEQLVA